MSHVPSDPKPASRYMSISEYAEIQRENGSCKEEFAQNVAKTTKVGLIVGVPLGLYVGYGHHGLAPKAFIGKSLSMGLATVMCFSGIGVFIATYNCLRVVR
ncbi:hypothetical protein M3Y96_01055700 [Aphelenchoides besseyi]|nr:hypothetical protein M3Y96_01055700 [Aphelenchoides besseyi]